MLYILPLHFYYITPVCNPIVCYANISRDTANNARDELDISNVAAEGLEIDAQCVYLLDQFTEKSLERLINLKTTVNSIAEYGSEAAQKKALAIAQNIIANNAEYDTGIREAKSRTARLENYKENSMKERDGKSNAAYTEMKNTLAKIMQGYDTDQKLIFMAVNKSNLKQDADIAISLAIDKEKLSKAFERIAKKDPAILTKTLMDAQLFTERQTHKDFSYNRVYTLADEKATEKMLLPQWGRFEDKDRIPVSFTNNATREKLKNKSHKITLPSPKRERHQSYDISRDGR